MHINRVTQRAESRYALRSHRCRERERSSPFRAAALRRSPPPPPYYLSRGLRHILRTRGALYAAARRERENRTKPGSNKVAAAACIVSLSLSPSLQRAGCRSDVTQRSPTRNFCVSPDAAAAAASVVVCHESCGVSCVGARFGRGGGCGIGLVQRFVTVSV